MATCESIVAAVLINSAVNCCDGWNRSKPTVPTISPAICSGMTIIERTPIDCSTGRVSGSISGLFSMSWTITGRSGFWRSAAIVWLTRVSIRALTTPLSGYSLITKPVSCPGSNTTIPTWLTSSASTRLMAT